MYMDNKKRKKKKKKTCVLTFISDGCPAFNVARDEPVVWLAVAGAYAFLAWVMPGMWRANCPNLLSNLDPFLAICAKISSLVGWGAGAGAGAGGAVTFGFFTISGCIDSSNLTAELNLITFGKQ